MDDRHTDDTMLSGCPEAIEKNRDVIAGVKMAHYWTSLPWDPEHQPWAGIDRAEERRRAENVPIVVDFWPRPPLRLYAEPILKKMRPGRRVFDPSGLSMVEWKTARKQMMIV